MPYVYSQGYSRLITRGEHLYFLGRTADWNDRKPARVKLNGTGREFLSDQSLYGMGDVWVSGDRLMICGVIEEASIRAHLFEVTL